jgi:hypothetical protein
VSPYTTRTQGQSELVHDYCGRCLEVPLQNLVVLFIFSLVVPVPSLSSRSSSTFSVASDRSFYISPSPATICTSSFPYQSISSPLAPSPPQAHLVSLSPIISPPSFFLVSPPSSAPTRPLGFFPPRAPPKLSLLYAHLESCNLGICLPPVALFVCL